MKKRVKIKSSWCDDKSILNRLLIQFKTSEDDVSNIHFVDDNSYELIVFFGYVNEELVSSKEYIILPQEPSWSGNHQKSFPNTPNLTVYGFDKDLYNFNGKVEEKVSMMFYGGRGPESEGWENWTYENVIHSRPKTKNICSLISNLGLHLDEVADGCLYKKRVEVVKRIISDTDFIDVYSWDGEKPNIKGWLNKKIDGLLDYKFSLCIENSSEKNYLTEKFFDCILTDTIPIYYGCKNIKELLPEDGYILIEDIDNIDGVINLLKNIHQNCDEIYNRKIINARKIKEIYFRDFNPLRLINEICGK